MHAIIQNPGAIDLLTYDQTLGECILIISASDEWNGTHEEQDLLLQKINTYLHYILDGDLTARCPQAAHGAIRIQIDTASAVPRETAAFLADVQGVLARQNIALSINLLEH